MPQIDPGLSTGLPGLYRVLKGLIPGDLDAESVGGGNIVKLSANTYEQAVICYKADYDSSPDSPLTGRG